MSTYSKQTKHPITGEWHEATWIDDFYGSHRYGVQFPDGETFNPDNTKLETKENEPVTTNYVDSRTPEEREADSKIETTVTTASAMTYTENIDEMVRDFCSVAPKSKSEVRQRISDLITQALAEDRERLNVIIQNLLLAVESSAHKNEKGEDVVYAGQVNRLMGEVDDLLSSLDKYQINKDI